jgi:hypothetical protein
MMGDCQVRFCERLGVKLPRSTRRAPRRTRNDRDQIALVNISEFAVIKMVDCKLRVSTMERNELLQINRGLTNNQKETINCRIEPPAGTNRGICQTALRCFS